MNFKKNVFVLMIFIAFTSYSQENDIQYQWLRGYQKVDARREIRIPDILGFKTLKGDFHSHTIFSDGRVLPQERVDEAWREGLDVIAITDHSTPIPGYISADYNTPYKMAKRTAIQRGITLIQAVEYTKSEPVGHLNFLFLKNANPFKGDSLSPTQAIHLASEMGAFVIYNHPGWPDKNSELDTFHINHINAGRIQGMEVFNSGEFYPVVMDYVNLYNVTPFSNTDIHSPIQSSYEVNNTFRNMTLVFATDNSENAIKEAMTDGRTVAFANNILAGKEKFLQEILRKSLLVSNYKTDGTTYSCNIANQSDITWFFSGANHRHITFPANRTVQLNGEVRELNTIYQVSNTYISSVSHLEFPLHFIFTKEQEVSMPFIKQNITMIEPGTKIEVFCSTVGAEIRYTLDGTEPTSVSPLYNSPLQIEKSSVISLKAFKPGMEPSRIFKGQALLTVLHPGEKLKNVQNGVNYKYFEGNIISSAEIETKGKLIKEGTATFPDISLAQVDDHFGMIFTGYIFAPVDGLYTFSLQSDDGSTLKISGVELVDNDGSHSLTKVSATMNLKKGYHSYEIRFMEDYE
ncbi:MAG TPA: chitobiase/beta-hexosaminidase C-terminal domain-containing protein, partial [Draconibacterium sp.]|nr:chitobiase/beta-hexosaminidase C-terminal domain-containing protein [Draconibacterium sp.]